MATTLQRHDLMYWTWTDRGLVYIVYTFNNMWNINSTYWLDVSRDSSVGIVTGYGLDEQTGSGVHPNSYKGGTGGSFPRIKRQGREADHSPPTSAEVKKMWIYTSTSPYVFMA
jgi:hypothetical protein